MYNLLALLFKTNTSFPENTILTKICKWKSHKACTKNQDFSWNFIKYQENIRISRPNFSNHDNIKKIKKIKTSGDPDPTICSNLNYSIKRYSLKSVKYSVSHRGPTLRNTILDKRDKEIESHLLFKNKINPNLLDITNEQKFF